MLKNKLSLGFFPTPIHKLENLSDKYSDYNIFIKRDDLTGLATGGNKTRKLEYLFKDATDQNCDSVITAGAQQSNHCRQTAAAAAKLGIECHLMLGGKEPNMYNGNLLISLLTGANLHFCNNHRKGEDINALFNELLNNKKSPYIIPYGGSNIIGATGYINAMKELQKQLKTFNLKIDYIFFASSSGGTLSGMILGKKLFNIKSEIIPVRIDKETINNKTQTDIVFELLEEGFKKYKIKNTKVKHLNLLKNYDDAGYGNLTENEKISISELAEEEGILLDPVYTGRAFYAMTDQLSKGNIPKKSNILFWHTGGTPAIFEYADNLL